MQRLPPARRVTPGVTPGEANDGTRIIVEGIGRGGKTVPCKVAGKEVEKYRGVIAGLDFDTVCTPFEHAPGVTRGIALAVLDDQLRGPPGVRNDCATWRSSWRPTWPSSARTSTCSPSAT